MAKTMKKTRNFWIGMTCFGCTAAILMTALWLYLLGYGYIKGTGLISMAFFNAGTVICGSDFPASVDLSPFERVVDTRAFVDGHLSILRARGGEKAFLPYCTRLLKFKSNLSHDPA